MVKKDPPVNENVDRNNQVEKDISSAGEKNEDPGSDNTKGFTEVKNAHASGDGAMGTLEQMNHRISGAGNEQGTDQ